MDNVSIGNQLNRIAQATIHSLFSQGEIVQLTYSAFEEATKSIQDIQNDEIVITYPIGYNPDQTTMQGSRTYQKQELLDRHIQLATVLLPMNGLFQIVTNVEALLTDSVRAVVAKFPKKLGQKRSVSLQLILESKSIEEVHIRATDELLHELSYKSPREFAEHFEQLLSINLLECPAYHKYIEVKATRDIHIHNRGIVNDTYSRKAGSHARAIAGKYLPVTVAYFLESYEAALQLNEWLERAFDQHWHSSEYEERNKSLSNAATKTPFENPVGITTSEPNHPEQKVKPKSMKKAKMIKAKSAQPV
jgi:hypothetical protein